MKSNRNASTAPQSAKQIGNAPHVAYEQAKAEWAERMGDSVVDKSRLFIIAALLACCLLGMIIAFNVLLPLKSTVPVQIETDKLTGEVSPRIIQAQDFKPTDISKKYFIGRWIRNVINLDPALTESNLRDAFQFVRGKAIDEYKDFIDKTKPLVRLAEDKTLTRKTDILTFNFMTETVANVRFQTEERRAGATPVIKRYAALIHFEVVPPTTEKETMENPLGIFITDFSFSEETQ